VVAGWGSEGVVFKPRYLKATCDPELPKYAEKNNEMIPSQDKSESYRINFA